MSSCPVLDRSDAENGIDACDVDIYAPNQPSNADKGQGRVWVRRELAGSSEHVLFRRVAYVLETVAT